MTLPPPPGGNPPTPPPGGPFQPPVGGPGPYPGPGPQQPPWPQQPWTAGPPPQKRGNGWKWALGTVALLAVIGVTAAVTMSVTGDNGGNGSPTSPPWHVCVLLWQMPLHAPILPAAQSYVKQHLL